MNEPLLTYRETMDKAAHKYLTTVLTISDGNSTHAAKIAKYNRTSFHKLLTRHGINIKAFRSAHRTARNNKPVEKVT